MTPVKRYDEGSGYLLQNIGKPYELNTKASYLRAFDTLVKLHQAGFTHGDPPLANILLVNSEAKWIDFSCASTSTSNGVFQEDAKMLLKSMLDLNQQQRLPDNMEDAVKSYCPTDTSSIKRIKSVLYRLIPVKQASSDKPPLI